MTKKRTDGGHEIPEEDLREMEQEESREVSDGVEWFRLWPGGAKQTLTKP